MRRHAGLSEDLAGFAAPFEREREQKALDGDKAVAGLLAGFLGRIEHARQRRIEIDLPGAAARNLRTLGERRLDGGQSLAGIAPRPIDQTGGEPFGVVEQNLQQVLGRKLLVSLAQRERLGRLNETAAAVGIFVEIHVPSLGLFRRPGGAIGTSSWGCNYAGPLGVAVTQIKREASPAGGPKKASANQIWGRYGPKEEPRRATANT